MHRPHLDPTYAWAARTPITLKGDSGAESLGLVLENRRFPLPILAARGRPARVPRPIPDPRGDDVPDQPLAGRHARGRRGAPLRVRAGLEHARRPRLRGGLVGAA